MFVVSIYFASMQHMLSHRARQHPDFRVAKKRTMDSCSYAAQTVDGMPVCAHCGQSFTRVEALKKHLHQACPILHTAELRSRSIEGEVSKAAAATAQTQSLERCTRSGGEVQVASEPEGLLGLSGRTPVEHVQQCNAPLIGIPAFVAALRVGWKNVLRVDSYRRCLASYCVLCGQWVDSSGVKQHHRLMHAKAWELFGSDGPCQRAWTACCVAVPPLWQGSQGPQSAHTTLQHRLSSIISGPCLSAGVPWRQRAEENQPTTAAQEMLSVLGLAKNAMTGNPEHPWARREPTESLQEDAARVTKWPKQQSKGHMGKGQAWDQWRPHGLDWFQKDESTATVDQATQQVITALVKMAIRHEEQLAKIRIDTTMIVYLDTGAAGILPLIRQMAEAWSTEFEAGKVTSPLKVVLLLGIFQEVGTRITSILQDEEKQEKAREWAWLQAGATALDPLWTYFQWNTTAKKQEPSPHPPIKNSEVRKHLDYLALHLSDANVLTRFRATRRMSSTDRYAQCSLAIFLRPQPKRRDCHDIRALVNCSALKTVGLRIKPARGERQPLAAELEKAYLEVPYTQLAAEGRSARGARRARGPSRASRTWMRSLLSSGSCFSSAGTFACQITESTSGVLSQLRRSGFELARKCGHGCCLLHWQGSCCSCLSSRGCQQVSSTML